MFILILQRSVTQHSLQFPSIFTMETKKKAYREFVSWKQAFEKNGSIVNIAKTKMMIKGKNIYQLINMGRAPFGVRGGGMGVHNIICTKCDKRSISGV